MIKKERYAHILKNVFSANKARYGNQHHHLFQKPFFRYVFKYTDSIPSGVLVASKLHLKMKLQFLSSEEYEIPLHFHNFQVHCNSDS